MDDSDKYRPTNATAEGQMISFAGGLRRYKYGKAIALFWLLAGAVSFLVIAVSIAKSM